MNFLIRAPGFSVYEKLARRECSLAIVVATILFTIFIMAGCSPPLEVDKLPPAGDTVDNITGITELPPLYDENVVVSLYERVIPAVVEIRTVTGNIAVPGGPFEIDLPPREGQGSGFIIDNKGYILTNHHVVVDATTVKVILHEGSTLDADVIGTDRENDLALIQIGTDEITNILPLVLGDSDSIKPGQMAIALGSPFGLGGSITLGIISAVGRAIPSETQRLIANMLQTDAAINPGNSGGPLLNSRGEVIGINAAIGISSIGIGFAIPINTAKSLLPALLKGGEVRSPWLGIRGRAIGDELAQRLDLPVNRGVYIVAVLPDSPAEKAGLRESGINEQGTPAFGGDIIIAVDGHAVARVEDLIAYFNGKRPGDEISLLIYREDENLTIEVTLGDWPEQLPTPESIPHP